MQTVLNTTTDKNVISKIQNVTESHIFHLAKNKLNRQKIHEIFVCLKIMLNKNYKKYKFDENIFDTMLNEGLCEIELQEVLSKLNEKQDFRKTNGVYYTPKDVVSFIVDNCLNQRIKESNAVISKLETQNHPFEYVVYNTSVFDPTCGTGEFLFYALEKKIQWIKSRHRTIDDYQLILILNTIYGNDINVESIEITKIRLFFEIIKYATHQESYRVFATILNQNMLCQDFLNIDHSHYPKFDIIIGNPPYVEDRKSPVAPNVRYGNIYANVLQNSVDMLSPNGVMGFIVPISYTATPRMKKIREYMERHTKKQFILHYADRPDCLFTSVHQKLSILLAVQGSDENKLFTTGYQYWYKNERAALFANTMIIENEHRYEDFYPKIGNGFEKSIFEKVFTQTNDSILEKTLSQEPNVFLNMRACFWIKAFSFSPGSKEYKGFCYDGNLKDFMLCLLNSSLFFLYWNTVSDCWHITAKELKHFRIPENIPDIEGFTLLSAELENKLENTKRYIGSKQTEYEYKHKQCKDVIDKIDDALAAIYNITPDELAYIKSYSSRYRESLGG